MFKVHCLAYLRQPGPQNKITPKEPAETEATKETDPEMLPIGIIRYRDETVLCFLGHLFTEQIFSEHRLDTQSSSRS